MKHGFPKEVRQNRSEAEMRALLDEALYAGFFGYETEVTGAVAHSPHGYDMKKKTRIDYVVHAGRAANIWGWPPEIAHFGIEAKKEGSRFGPAFAQALDYRLLYDFGTPLDVVFCYPFDKGGGELASVTAQTRIGRIAFYEFTNGSRIFSFCIGQNPIGSIEYDAETGRHTPIPRHNRAAARSIANHGRKVGSR